MIGYIAGRVRSGKVVRQTALLAAVSVAALMGGATQASAQEEEDGVGLSEIIVTSRKQQQYLQDVAVSVSAMSSETLSELNVSNFEDYVRYMPSVVAAGNGPGQSAFYIRGLATSQVDIGLSEIGGTSPNVALYLDEQPVSTISRNLDVYTTDLARVEVLPGPQGTLFGAGSQAGTIRLITNPPVINETSAKVEFGAATTRHGEMSNSVEGYINLPVIEDKLAVRVVGYLANRGGYIDNVPASLTLPATNNGIVAGGYLTRLQDPDVVFHSKSNAEFVEKDFNDASYAGFRVGALYQIDNDWSVRLQYMRQRLETEGVFYDDPASAGDGEITNQPNGAGKYAISTFYPNNARDDFQQISGTIEGRIGDLQLIYTGAYLDRTVEQQYDYAGYIKEGLFVAYYTCDYYAPADRTPICYDPTYGSNMSVDFRRHTHELRGSLDIGDRVHAIAGVFYDNSRSGSDIRFIQPGIETLVQVTPPYYASNGQVPVLVPYPNAVTTNPNPREIGTTFFNDVIRKEEQIAGFGELTVDLVPDRLSITGGIRYYSIDVSLGGSTRYIFGGVNIDEVLAGQSPANESGATYKGNITWTPNDDLLFYATYSEGFRPGGFNRNGGTGNDPTHLIPYHYGSDMVRNYELGWKTEFFNRRLRVNGSVYQIDWTNMQLAIQDISISPLTFIENVGKARIRGAEGDIAFAATRDLTLFASYAYTDAKLISAPSTISNIAPEGSQLAFVPKFQFTTRARYETPISDSLDGFFQVALQHSGKRYNSLQLVARQQLDDWTTMDLSMGVKSQNWALNLYVENLTDERVVRSVIYSDPRLPEVIGRPRTIGARVSYSF